MSDSIVATAPAETLTPEQAAAPEPSWKWWWSRCYQRYRGPFDTKAEALADARGYYDDYAPLEEIVIVEVHGGELHDDIFDAEEVLESFNDWNEDQDLAGDGCIDARKVSADQRKELETALKDALSAWRAKHNLGTAWALAEANVSTVRIAATATDGDSPDV